ncbi:MAG TPA: DNA alkylation repair protein [Desulfitobacterium dehalogenans]|uniref:DNA alkylation repair protein n=1 Tax=Desulfitobacterium dehalogenans TaxID=36854 RepID=A0A7C6Z6R5_9FIRM|nr:DNA alkylation repair protein [Desulfitobacterium dehalogenans]
MQAKIKDQLGELAEEEYRVFASGLLPNISNILGVRLPLLRKMAKEITKADWREYLKTAREDFFEEIMLQGMVIGCAQCSPEERLSTIREFVPKINNWSVCDSFCSGLNFTKENMKLVWEFLQPYARSEEEFEIRFAVVMLLFYYSDKEHIEAVLEILDSIRHEGYYVKMAVAWAVSICFIKLPEQTIPYLQNNHLDDFTHNKSLQKITESYRVDQETKKQIRLMKRK